jgi:hypothetical protein
VQKKYSASHNKRNKNKQVSKLKANQTTHLRKRRKEIALFVAI